MKLKIYLFRHGQTYYNKKHIFTGWKDSQLTPKGIKDAKKVAQKLKNKKFQVAYQTRLSRSKDTLKHVLKFHPECQKIIKDNRMIERSYGKLQGLSHKSFVEREGKDSYQTLLHWHKIDHLNGKERKDFIKKMGEAELKIVRRSYDVPPPKGESVKMVEKRVNSFIKDLLKKMKKEKINVAISAHGNSMRPFRKYFEKLSREQMMELENPWDDYFEYTINIKK
ncbi:2,3-bisphosphoglycerate-dependent phosphoglycerate mutase [Candidatus Woesearchaeota archaeon]|jgi:2,3-bisphosphoglycerate-dependent phosphoglycerate mutase|nr:2,3-bisphosphoglycerate-dependent phosphoglycerate mutase [Candidatus Woesearchaeota archaeon]